MSRQSITITMQEFQKKGLDYTWQQTRRILKEKGFFVIDELQDYIHTTQCIETTRGWVNSWVKAGYLKKCGSDYYEGVKKTHAAPRVRRDGTIVPEAGQERLWRAMKILKKFTVAELCGATACIHSLPVPVSTAERYLSHLVRVKICSKNEAREYRLIKSLGGAAPKILQTKAVYDPNSNRIIGEPVVSEVAS